MITKKEIGDMGEDLATSYMEKQGYLIKARKYRTRVGEIDIIAEKNEQIVFVEVKTRTGLDCGEPIEAVDKRKLQRIHIVGEEYKHKEGKYHKKSRIDVIEVLIAHHEDIGV